MNLIVKQKWVAALRSGEFKQTQKALFDGNGYCCLGVLCELAIKDGVRVEKLISSERVWFYDEESGLVPYSVQSWADINLSPQIRMDSGFNHPLSNINDDGSSFEEIANLIEAQL